MIYFVVLVYVVVCNLHLKCALKCGGRAKTKQCHTVELLGEHCPLVARQGSDLSSICLFHKSISFSMSFSVCGSFELLPAVCTCVYTCVRAQCIYVSIWINWCQAKEMRLRERETHQGGWDETSASRGGNRWAFCVRLINSRAYTYRTNTTARGEDKAKTRRTRWERRGGGGHSPFLLTATWTLFPQGRRVNRQVGTATAGAYRTPRILINSYFPGENDEKPKPLKGRQMRESCSKHTDQ